MLDPRRIGLNAADIGFQKRMHQDLDYTAIDRALQTDYNNQGSAIQVRRERDAVKDEIHIMGGELAGFQSNDLIKTLARQDRQINGYPLRHFDAQNPAVILPAKYGGFPLYNRNQVEYPDYVSLFTEPMSAPLQRDTELLSRMGRVPISNSLTRPFEEDGYVNPMTTSFDKLQANKNEFVQRKHLRNMSERSKMQKFNVPDGEKGIYINPNGDPMSTVQEQLSGQIVANNTFADAQRSHLTRVAAYQNPGVVEFNLPLRATAGSLLQERGEDDFAIYSAKKLPASSDRWDSTAVVSRTLGFRFAPAEASTVDFLSDNAYNMTPTIREQVAISQPNLVNTPTASLQNGLQPASLFPSGNKLGWGSEPGTPTISFKPNSRSKLAKANRELGVVHASAMKRRANKTMPGAITPYRKRSASKAGLTPFSHKKASMLDYRTPGSSNKSIASAGKNRY